MKTFLVNVCDVRTRELSGTFRLSHDYKDEEALKKEWEVVYVGVEEKSNTTGEDMCAEDVLDILRKDYGWRYEEAYAVYVEL